LQLTKKQTNVILRIYDTWMYSYLNGDVQTYDSYFDDDYHFIGSTNNEEFLNRNDTTNFFKATAEQFSGKTELRNETKTLEHFGELIFITHIFDAWFLNGTEWTYYSRFRFSSVLQEKKEGWKFIYQHFSVADSKTDEGETIGFDKVNLENQVLREAIKRRTFELEEKNRELEIEAALEKVRSRTMAMQHSDELQEASFLLDEQVRALGIKTWGCAFNVYGEQDSTEWFGNEAGVLPTYTVPREGIFKEYYQKGQKGESLYIQEFSGKTCIEHYEYMSSLPVIGDVLKNLKKANNGFPTYQIDNVIYFKYGYLLFITREPVPDAHDIFKRFAKVFEQTYTRFLDLQKAEAQTKEAQIETALERVRSRSMAMHKSEELLDVISVVSEQLQELDFKFVHVSFAFNDRSQDYNFWVSAKGQTKPMKFTTPYIDIAVFNNLRQAQNQSLSFFTDIITKKEHNKWHKHLLKHGGANIFTKKDNEYIMSRGMARSIAINPNITLILANYASIPYSEEDNKIIERFGQVFEQSYTRFLDLQKAEAQARDAKIETALERVRSRSMAMHKSEELKDVIQVVYKQFVHLNIHTEHTGFIIDYKEHEDMHIWLADQNAVFPEVKLPYFDCAHWNSFKDAKKNGGNFFTNLLTFKEKNKFYKDLFKFIPDIPKEAKDHYLSCPGLAISTVLLDNIGLYIENFDGIPYTDKENVTLMRFGKVFQQTYTRFLDLKKAEAQARESQIEHALEKVRSRTMAMQNSDELPEAANNLFLQVQALGIPAWSAGYCIWEADNKSAWCSMSSEGEIQKGFSLPTIGEGYNFNKPFKNKEPFHVSELGGKALVKHYDFMKTLPTIGEILVEFDKKGISLPTFQIFHIVYFSHGYLMFITYEPVPNDWDVFKRFGNVFEQTYTRFLDLQKAEAQARESKIEASLEKMRSVTLSLTKSEDMLNIAKCLFEQLLELGFNDMRNAIIDIHNDDETFLDYDYSHDMSSAITKFSFYGDPVIEQQIKTTESSSDAFFEIELKGKQLEELIETRRRNGEKDDPRLSRIDQLTYNLYSFGNGAIGISNFGILSDDQKILLKRFRNVFTFAYKRYTDLVKAEVQAREAKIEASLEKVRSTALGMQKSDDILDIAQVLYEQLVILGFSDIRNSLIDLHNDDDETFWDYDYSDEMSGTITLMRYDDDPIIERQIEKIESSNDAFFELILEGKELQDLIDLRIKNGEEQDPRLLKIDQLTYNLYSFGDGAIGISNFGKLDDEKKKILKRFRNVFTFAYKRYKDIQKSEAQAREAQIEIALEKVRSVALSLKKSDDMLDIAKVLFEQLLALGFHNMRNTIIDIHNDDETFTDYDYSHEMSGTVTLMSYGDDPTLKEQFRKTVSSKDDLFEIVLEGQKLQDLIEVRLKNGEKEDSRLRHTDRLTYNMYSFGHGAIGTSNFGTLNDEEKELLKRFRNVFTFAYQRFSDLQAKEIQSLKLEEEKQRLEKTLSNLQETQKQLIQSEKMASLGELTAGIAHEIQNPLNFVNNFSDVSKELLEEMLEEMEDGNMEEVKAIMNDIVQNLEKIHHHGKRADGIVKGMLQHSRASDNKKESTNINKLADEYLRLAYHGLRAKDKTFNSQLITDFDETIGTINIIPQDIGRVILNLLTNAFYVVNEKKKSGSQDYEPLVSIRTKMKKKYIEIVVSDNGDGIPDHVMEKIFQPFFTTKPTGQGTGLGLSMSYDIITKGHGGELKVETKKGKKTTFTIILPKN